MVRGVEMVFSKRRMLERLKRDGRLGEVTAEIIGIMDNLDGQAVTTSSWNRQVYLQPVYSCTAKDGSVVDVNENDCVFLTVWEAENGNM